MPRPIMPRIALAVLASTIVAALAGCGDNGQRVEETLTTPTEETSPVTTSAPPQTSTFVRDVRENYGTPGYEVSWWQHVQEVKVALGSGQIWTEIYPDEEGRALGRTICLGAFNLGSGVDHVQVLGSDGGPLATCP